MFIVCFFVLALGFTVAAKSTSLSGSWRLTKGNDTWILMAMDGYCMITHYDLSGKKFHKTFGGLHTVENGNLTINYRFCSDNKAKTGTSEVFTWKVKGDKAISNLSGEEGEWQKVGAADNKMSGIWRITGRKEGNVVKDMPLAPRRTLKFLTNDRFQWAAINVETGEFSGTGGGMYTFKNGVYAETIEFFSRDNSRVGMTLEFKDHLEGQNWIHTGVSSKGAPIYEVWSKMEKEL
ncbi:hypothetical protein A8C56_15940 [Niabella ginsenosidivorans]|uniref:Membrane or secreted protein n=1 Tax=Niabella ginsenosidivorans TaxID=1176587 RepID=A0A1A9IB62_9BACT|nr:hypothetical protein A8C56_15940 [Niabella ginsenosidivorans]